MRQRASITDMVSSVARLIIYASRSDTLHPGDLLYTGACAGVGPIRSSNVLLATATLIGNMRVVVRGA